MVRCSESQFPDLEHGGSISLVRLFWVLRLCMPPPHGRYLINRGDEEEDEGGGGEGEGESCRLYPSCLFVTGVETQWQPPLILPAGGGHSPKDGQPTDHTAEMKE